MHLTYHDETTKASGDRPSIPEIEITPEMIEAGVSVLLGELGGCVDRFWSAPDLAKQVFEAMACARAR